MGSTPIYSIPFADPTDLVRDWPALSEDVAEAVESAIAGVPVLAGIGSNVVQAVVSTVFNTTSDTLVALPGVTVNITPSTATSRVLLFANSISSSDRDSRGGEMAIFRGATQISELSIQTTKGDAPNFDFENTKMLSVVDSPESSSAQTYSVRVKRHNAFGTTRFYWGSIIAIEVAP